MADSLEEQLLPPFPDELVLRLDLVGAKRFLRAHGWPSWIARRHLRQFSLYTGVEVTYRDYQEVTIDMHKPPEI